MRYVESVEDWVVDRNKHGLAVSDDVYSLTGRWFDFVAVHPDEDIVVREGGVDVGRVVSMFDAYAWVEEVLGVEL